MGNEITFTPIELWLGFLSICGGISGIGAAAAVIIKAVKAVKKPSDDHNTRITSLESRVDAHDILLRDNKERFESIEAGNQVMQRAMLALLDHSIDGNNIAQMKKAKDDLQNYLIGGKKV